MESIMNSWVRVGFNAWMLAWEAATVVPLRAMRMFAGRTAGEAEVHRVMDEIKETASALPGQAKAGVRGLKAPEAAAKAIKTQRAKVQATRRRLAKA